MRPNQQNNKNRQRGRNNNGGRKHVNPLSRNYESNGPDVKVRGNAAHIAEKYLQLARDAQSSGDPVLAENYLQHAEHYFRIVAAAQPQAQRQDQFGQPIEEEDFDDDFAPINDRFASPERPQPVYQQNSQPQQQNQPQQSMNGEQPQFQPRIERNDDEAGDEQQAGDQGLNGENAEGQPVAAQGGEGEPRRHRDRRPRRRRNNGGSGGEGTDPGNAPQPDVGELPAFITAGGGSAAE